MEYSSRAEALKTVLARLNVQNAVYSVLRVLTAICFFISLYFFPVALLGTLASVAVFVVLVFRHRRVQEDLIQKKAELEVNLEEIRFLEENIAPGQFGEQFLTDNHPYTFDLDVFGPHSLFHFLDRTHTFSGYRALGHSLLKKSSDAVARQEAIRELSSKLDFRQAFNARARRFKDTEKEFAEIVHWSEQEADMPRHSPWSYLFPLALVAVFIAYSLGAVSGRWVLVPVLLNLVATGQYMKAIKKELIASKRVGDLLKHYGALIGMLEREEFQAEFLQKRQAALNGAGVQLGKVGSYFQMLHGINFALGAIILNALCQYHVHVYRRLVQWRQAQAKNLGAWMEVMGEMEALMSYGNFAYNESDFTYPQFTEDIRMDWKELGHPLISKRKRVCNDLHLDQSNFMILTGSNMSGKSTFLRTLGINVVLAGAGAPVCARKAELNLLPLYVSMRQSDSLASGESYFFAEVKRLKHLMEAVSEQPTLVLLDEILRGTNSDDKQAGTIGVIQKLLGHTVIGGIATHDLEVCRLSEIYPQRLENMNFEVEIVNEQLVFDYKLRKGICKNKSATFLMRKMEII
jgi:hypothetical protein